MARVLVSDERVQKLLRDRLVPAFAAAGTVRQLTNRLNEVLRKQGSQEILYPNRLRQLMSDSASQSVNQATLAIVEQAAFNLPLDKDAVDEGLSRLSRAVLDRWDTTRISHASYSAVADDLNLPPAVVRVVLELAGQLPAEGVPGPQAPPQRRGVPDWRFQDEAVNRCVAELNSAPAAKIGAVLPTGAGKTRIGLRISLRLLQTDRTGAGVVLWITHRRNLRRQARRELQKMAAPNGSGSGPDATEASELAERIEFIMLSEVGSRLTDPTRPVLMVVVDEAHHAAAPSYAPIFDAPYPLKGLFITATPNRTDLLPLGIDRIAYSITSRELADRNVILLPEIREFPVDDFDWSSEAVNELAEQIVERTKGEYTKVLVLAPRIDRVEEFYRALVAAIAAESGHPLSQQDIGYVHNGGNPLRIPTDDYLDLFAAKPRAIMVSAQLLLEGFDDPAINTVVVTYESTSLIVLLQAAGRCVRYAPGKTAAYVVLASNPDIAYRFDHRWLYQEISDFLRPQLVDIPYVTPAERHAKASTVLAVHRVEQALAQKALDAIRDTPAGGTCRLVLYGLTYFGDPDAFDCDAKWGAIAETPANSSLLREIFNDFCALGANLSDPTDFLHRYAAREGIEVSDAPASDWRMYVDLLTSMYFARGEVYGGMADAAYNADRPYQPSRATTWLKYVTLDHQPAVAPELSAFLEDCYNREQILSDLSVERVPYRLLIKIPVPLEGYEAHLLDEQGAATLTALTEEARTAVGGVPPAERFAQIAAFTARMGPVPLAPRVADRLEVFMPAAGWTHLTYPLNR